MKPLHLAIGAGVVAVYLAREKLYHAWETIVDNVHPVLSAKAAAARAKLRLVK